MGHRQEMTYEQRRDWDLMQYQAKLEARRGNNFSYLNDEQREDLEKKGYKKFIFDDDKKETPYSRYAKECVKTLRESGHFARIVVNPCYKIIGGQTYSVWYKKKSNS